MTAFSLECPCRSVGPWPSGSLQRAVLITNASVFVISNFQANIQRQRPGAGATSKSLNQSNQMLSVVHPSRLKDQSNQIDHQSQHPGTAGGPTQHQGTQMSEPAVHPKMDTQPSPSAEASGCSWRGRCFKMPSTVASADYNALLSSYPQNEN